MPKINVIFHSVSGGTYRIVEEIAKGVEEIDTCTATLLRVPEPGGAEPITMPGLRVVHHQFEHVPEATIQGLEDCDGLALGTPVYWGGMSYAMKHYLDSAAVLWDLGSPDKPVQSAPNLAGKPATAFTGGGSGLTHSVGTIFLTSPATSVGFSSPASTGRVKAVLSSGCTKSGSGQASGRVMACSPGRPPCPVRVAWSSGRRAPSRSPS
jgi:hypothetical protein